MIDYVVGDATDPIGDDPAVIVHVCNDIGAWGAGFVLALNKAFGTKLRDYYRMWYEHDPWSFKLGAIQPVLVNVGRPIVVINMIAQHGIERVGDRVPLQYVELLTALVASASWIEKNLPSAEVHMPRIGCGLAGGKWEMVEVCVEYAFGNPYLNHPIPVHVYDLP